MDCPWHQPRDEATRIAIGTRSAVPDDRITHHRCVKMLRSMLIRWRLGDCGWRLAVGDWRLGVAIGGLEIGGGDWRLAIGDGGLAIGGWRLGDWRLAGLAIWQIGVWRLAFGRLAIGVWRLGGWRIGDWRLALADWRWRLRLALAFAVGDCVWRLRWRFGGWRLAIGDWRSGRLGSLANWPNWRLAFGVGVWLGYRFETAQQPTPTANSQQPTVQQPTGHSSTPTPCTFAANRT